MEALDMIGRTLGGAFVLYLCSWIVRFAIRAELNRKFPQPK